MKPRDKRIKEYQRARAALEVRKIYFSPNEKKYHCDQQAMGRLNSIFFPQEVVRVSNSQDQKMWPLMEFMPLIHT